MSIISEKITVGGVEFEHGWFGKIEQYHHEESGRFWELFRLSKEPTFWYAHVFESGKGGRTATLNTAVEQPDETLIMDPLYHLNPLDWRVTLKGMAELIKKGRWPKEATE